jgi:hypothetical protein
MSAVVELDQQTVSDLLCCPFRGATIALPPDGPGDNPTASRVDPHLDRLSAPAEMAPHQGIFHAPCDSEGGSVVAAVVASLSAGRRKVPLTCVGAEGVEPPASAL